MAPSSEDGPPKPFKFSSPEGWTLCRDILKKSLPYEPHDYQIDGITKALDGVDVLAVTATGSGKSGYIYMLMLVVLAIEREPSLCPTAKFPKNAAAVVVCPTTSLEEDLERKIRETGLTALAITRNTLDEARKDGKNLWAKAESDTTVILVTPEMLTSKGFEQLLRQKKFQERAFALVVDEVHLMNSWGVGFRPSFLEVGNMRARFSSSVVLLALTATMRTGQPTKSICQFLGLHEGRFHLIRRSNIRHDVQILFRTLRSGLAATAFPELAWVLREKGKTLIFCRSIHLGFRVAVYLWQLDPSIDIETRRKRIRLYNSLNWPTFNAETLELLHSALDAQVTIATDTLSVGIDISDFSLVIVLDPLDTDEYVQKIGRVGRDRRLVSGARGIVYVGANAAENARKVVEERKENASEGKPQSTTGMDLSIAEMLLAECKVNEQNRQYDNPKNDVPCSCASCRENPPPPPPLRCSCSGCVPEEEAIVAETSSAPTGKRKRRAKTKSNSIPQHKRVTRTMRAHGVERLEKFRRTVWMSADERKTGWFPPDAFLPDDVIEVILNVFVLLKTPQDVADLVRDNSLLDGHHTKLFDVIVELRADFAQIRIDAAAASKAKKIAKAAAAAAAAAAVGSQASPAVGAGSDGEESSSDESSDEKDGINEGDRVDVDGRAPDVVERPSSIDIDNRGAASGLQR
ncbi:hypothetical protein PLICRDRAFT_547294 [Plicaturopsis crispa FD-325 SS-3]|nr:hypothetical protein PLICRDRAFT_547294 [Plicaturopsis crispa FD-325 SS-3]